MKGPPKMNELTTQELWEAFYVSGTKKDIFKDVKVNAVYRETAKFLNKHRNYFQDKSVIEFGCGDSQWLPYLSKTFNCKVSGVDYTEIGIQMAKKKLDFYKIEGELFHDNIVNFASNTKNKYDVVVSFGLLEHFHDRDDIYKSAVKISGEHGIFFALVPNLEYINLWWAQKFNKKLMSWHTSTPMTDVLQELRNNKFKVIACNYIGGLRLFAETNLENVFLQSILFVARKLINGLGEFISRLIPFNNRVISPYYCVLAELS